jgi:hypothetical protein
VYPPVVIWNAAASLVVVLFLEVGRQDHCLWLRLCFGASHAASVAGLSSRRSASIADSPADQQPCGKLNEWQATLAGILTHGLKHFCDTLWLLALIWPPLIHLAGYSVA